MTADISGHVDAADVLFLLAVILAGLAAFVSIVDRPSRAWHELAVAQILLYLAVGLVAAGLLVL